MILATISVSHRAGRPAVGHEAPPESGQRLQGKNEPSQGHFLEVSAGKIFYQVHGKGQAVVLVHDGLLHCEAWQEQWEALGERFQVVRYDRRGYGRSDSPTAAYSDIEDLRRLLDHLQIETAAIVGSSWGGKISIDFALQYPKMVERLVLVGPVVVGMAYSDHFRKRNAEAFKPLAQRGELAATIANWQHDNYLVAAENIAVKKKLGELLTANPQNLTSPRDKFQKSADWKAVSRPAEIAAPTLIVVGERDIPDVHAHAGALQAGIAHCKREVIHRAGHLVYLEQPFDFNRLVLEFLSEKRSSPTH